MENETGFDILNPFASVDLGIGERADGIKSWAMANRGLLKAKKQAA